MMRNLFLVALVVLFIGMGNNFRVMWQKDTNLNEQMETDYVLQKKNIVVRNAGGIKNSDSLILVVHGFYDKVISPSKRASYKVSEQDTLLVSYTDGTPGLSGSAKDLSKLIDEEYSQKYQQIFLVGISKGGCMSVEVAKAVKAKNITFINLDAPYEGTLLATPEALKARLAEIPLIGETFWKVYEKTFAWSTVDRDIALGSQYLKTLDYSGVEKHRFINVISTAGWKSLVKDIFWFNPEGIGCFFINEILEMEGDGIVANSSKKKINPHVDLVLKVNASHASSYYHILNEAIARASKMH